MHNVVTRWRRVATVLLLMGAGACAPAKAPPVAAAVPEEIPFPPIPYRRVDEWRFVDPTQGPTPAEEQLEQHLKRALPNARFSTAYACLAREHAHFRALHGAAPDEYLEQQMFGRCGASTPGRSMSVMYRSDGTLLERPLSPEVLNDLTAKLTAEWRDFTVFGITARYVGSNVLVLMDAAAPEATIEVGVPTFDGRVLVQGTILGHFRRARAIISQGDAGTADCEPSRRTSWPQYAFRCKLLPGDREAWISVIADDDAGGWENSLALLPVYRAGRTVAEPWRRKRLVLPQHSDPTTALITAINAVRAKAGRAPLKVAPEQSAFIQPIYEQAYRQNAAGDWVSDHALRARMIKGDHVDGVVRWGRIASGIAFDGDAADWLAYRLLYPITCEALMDPFWDQIAIATQHDPSVGFGAAAVLYSLITPERERALEDRIAQQIEDRRTGRRTERLKTPPEIEEAARQVATGSDPAKTFEEALTRKNLASKGRERLTGALLSEDSLPKALLEAEALRFGVTVTHHQNSGDDWARAVVFIWFQE